MDAIKRLWSVVKIDENGCCNRMCATEKFGYTRIRVNGERKLAHRYSWELEYGEIPEGLCVLHKCDNPRCINPLHLFLGSLTENNQDRGSKGRTRNGSYPGRWQKSVCQRGHLLEGDNVYKVPNSTRRNCLQCRREASVRWNQRISEQRRSKKDT